MREVSPTIKDMPARERPRERLLRIGPSALSSAELISIILRTGIQGQSALALAASVLQAFGGVRGIAGTSTQDLSTHKGIGPAKAVQMKAALELGRRAFMLGPEDLTEINNPKDVAEMVIGDMRYLDREHFKIVILNAKNRVEDLVTISVGCLDSSLAHPREVFKECVRRNCARIILVHNHPSGDPTPSDADIAITHRLANCGVILGIEVVDHIIVGDNKYQSLRELGLMEKGQTEHRSIASIN
ncbi:MAG: DNA repair protein RadC [Firmicutes bacterium]|nr:DNA repair protein RadC [Bacillota bacterium]